MPRSRLLSNGGWVSAGGDLAATAAVDVALPGGGAVRLERGGLATSGSDEAPVAARRCAATPPDRPAHRHCRRIALDAGDGLRRVCLEADVAAKAGFLLGDGGPDWLASHADPRAVPGRAGDGLNAQLGGERWRMHLTVIADRLVRRSRGRIVAYLLLTAVVAVGVGLAGRMNGKGWPRFAVEDVHRFGGILVGTFIAIHVADDRDRLLHAVHAGPARAVPLANSYRPIWTAPGIVAAELLLALAIANRLRHTLRFRWWKRTHYLNFAVWAAATAARHRQRHRSQRALDDCDLRGVSRPGARPARRAHGPPQLGARRRSPRARCRCCSPSARSTTPRARGTARRSRTR